MIKTTLYDFLYEEDAQGTVEYVLIAGVLILASYGAVKLFTQACKIKFDKVKSVRSGPAGIAP